MIGTISKQKAELRVVLHDNGRYHLLLDARVRGFDVYAGSGSPIHKKAKFKSSWHESGKTHIHTPIGRQIGTQKVTPQNFEGKAHLYTAGHGGVLSWDYAPKRDSRFRRTMIVQASQLRSESCSAELWAVEQGREDLVAEIVSGAGYKAKEVVGHIVADWTQPQLVAVASTLSEEAMRSFNRQIIEDSTKEIQLDPRNASAHEKRGTAYLHVGHDDRAIQDLEQAILLEDTLRERLSAYLSQALNRRGIEHLQGNEYDLSINDFNVSLRHTPSQSPVYANRGVAYFKMGEFCCALEDFTEALRITPDYVTSLANRGAVYLKLHEYDKAVDDLSLAITLKPDFALAYYNRACARSLQQDVLACIADLEQAIALESTRRESAKRDEDLKWARQDSRVRSFLESGDGEGC